MNNFPFRSFEVSDPRFEQHGLRQITVKSRSLRGRGDLTLFLPDGTGRSGELPLVILLHGAYGSHWAWTGSGGVHRTAQRMIATGEIAPMAIVMPSDGLRGDGSAYVQHADGVDFETWIVEEVPAAAALAAPGMVTASSPIFLGGLSMGGFGALRIGARFPEVFRAVSAHSAVTHLAQLTAVFEESPVCFALEEADQSVLTALVAGRGRLPPFRFDCGVDDSFAEHNRALHRALEEARIAHLYEEFPGGHDWPYWEKQIAGTLRFFSAHLPT